MKRCGKVCLLMLLVLVGILMGLLPVCAAEEPTNEQIGRAWTDLASALPPEVVALLPDSFFHTDIETACTTDIFTGIVIRYSIICKGFYQLLCSIGTGIIYDQNITRAGLL